MKSLSQLLEKELETKAYERATLIDSLVEPLVPKFLWELGKVSPRLTKFLVKPLRIEIRNYPHRNRIEIFKKGKLEGYVQF